MRHQLLLSFVHKGAYNSLIKGQAVRLHCCAHLLYETTAAQGHCGVFKLVLFLSQDIFVSKHSFVVLKFITAGVRMQCQDYPLHYVLGGIVGPSGLYFSFTLLYSGILRSSTWLPFCFSSSFTIIFFPRTLDLLLGSASLVLLLIARYGSIKLNPAHCLPLKRKVWYFCKSPLLFISPLCQV